MPDVVDTLKKERNALKNRLTALETAIEALSGKVVKRTKKAVKQTQKTVKKGMSEATKMKLRAAAKKRWALVKKAGGKAPESCVMIAIYIQKSWVATIGDMADQLLIREEPDNYISVLAGPTQGNFPFVQAQLARKNVTETGEVFLPAWIPTDLVSGIFDLTEGESKKYGFVQPK